jgi:hypothetical protein
MYMCEVKGPFMVGRKHSGLSRLVLLGFATEKYNKTNENRAYVYSDLIPHLCFMSTGDFITGCETTKIGAKCLVVATVLSLVGSKSLFSLCGPAMHA